MTLHRSLAILLLAAAFAGAAGAQGRGAQDDETIFAAVEDALQRSPSLATARITVKSRDGFVTLRGTAGTTAQIATAGRLAARVRGVTGVDNAIHITDRRWRA
jgi:osmotically-inducible protein OsmY